MELLQLRYFRAAAQAENFSRVAQQFYVPQSAVSRTIARLEKELGAPLFDRRGRRVVLNATGRQFLHHVDEALIALDKGTAQITGELKECVSLTMLAGSRLMPPVLAAFRARYPQVEFKLAGEKELNGSSSSCVLRHLPVPEGWEYCTLLTEKLMLAVPCSHPLAARRSVALEDLRHEGFIAFSRPKDLRAATDRAFAAAGFEPRICFECEDTATFRGMIENGLGVALVPQHTWQATPSDGVRLLPVEGLSASRTLVLAWNSTSGLVTYGVRLFRSFCEQWFARL